MTDPLLSRERAWALVTEHIAGESLRRHLLGVEAALRGYARLWGDTHFDGQQVDRHYVLADRDVVELHR